MYIHPPPLTPHPPGPPLHPGTSCPIAPLDIFSVLSKKIEIKKRYFFQRAVQSYDDPALLRAYVCKLRVSYTLCMYTATLLHRARPRWYYAALCYTHAVLLSACTCMLYTCRATLSVHLYVMHMPCYSQRAPVCYAHAVLLSACTCVLCSRGDAQLLYCALCVVYVLHDL